MTQPVALPHPGGEAALHSRCVHEGSDERLVDPLTEQTQSHVLALGNERGELQATQVEQKDMHGAAQMFLNGLLGQGELADVGLHSLGWAVVNPQP